MLRNLSIRKKLSIAIGIILLFMSIVGIVGILSLLRVSKDANYARNSAFRQAVLLVEAEGLVNQLLGDLKAAIDIGTLEGLEKIKQRQSILDRKMIELATVFAGDENRTKRLQQIRNGLVEHLQVGEQMVQMTFNQDWEEIGIIAQRYNASRDGIASQLDHLKRDGIGRLNTALGGIIELSQRTVVLSGIFIVMAMLVALVLTTLISRGITTPLHRLAKEATRVSAGDLTAIVEYSSNDELGILAGTFNQMTGSIRHTLGKVNSTFTTLHTVTGELATISTGIHDGSLEATESVSRMHHFVHSMKNTSDAITASMHEFSQTSADINSWLKQMVSSVATVAEKSESLSASVDDTTSSIREMSVSIEEVAQNVTALFNLVAETSSAMLEINSSIGEIEGMTTTSAALAEQVSSTAAREGISSVKNAVDGIVAVKENMGNFAANFRKFVRKVESITKIVNLIDEIADNTKLLSLNASILAAQAGEQGKGFIVVAQEIRTLSDRTIASTKDITDLIRLVQSESQAALQGLGQGIAIVDEGLSYVRQVETVFGTINKAAASSSEIASKIRLSTAEQARCGNHVSDSIQQIYLMSENIKRATGEQSSGARLIVDAAENIGYIAGIFRTTTEEQLMGSQQLASQMEDTASVSAAILSSVHKNAEEIDQLVVLTDTILHASLNNMNAIEQLNKNVTILVDEGKTLHKELDGINL